MQGDGMQGDLMLQGLLQFGLQRGQISLFCSRVGGLFWRSGDAAQIRIVFCTLDGLYGAERHGFIHVDGDLGGGGGKNTELLKGYLDGERKTSHFTLVDLRGSVQNHKEGK